MADVAVNTLAETRKLTSAGFTQQQAEATVEAIHTIATNNVAQKSDIKLVKKDITTLESKIDTMSLKVTFMIWVIGVMIAHNVLGFTLLQFSIMNQ
ncbi:MAG: hypothetical protein OXC62_15390 [Aestuariivita sp.]|nr:hypothetical protein [Aestuariivita sp.]